MAPGGGGRPQLAPAADASSGGKAKAASSVAAGRSATVAHLLLPDFTRQCGGESFPHDISPSSLSKTSHLYQTSVQMDSCCRAEDFKHM